MDVIDSDHKPVRCKFSVHLARVDRSVRRKEFGEAMNTSEEIKRLLQELSQIPETAVSSDSISLQNQETSFFQITNKDKQDDVVFHIICEGQCTINVNGEPTDLRPRGSFGFPSWLEVMISRNVTAFCLNTRVRNLILQFGISIYNYTPSISIQTLEVR